MSISRICLLLVTLLLILSACTSSPPPPNVLLILTDDQGYGDLSLYNNDSLFTPNMDHLATEGASFDRFFVSPVCAPTRAAILTGRYPERTGAWWVTRGWENMDPAEVTLAEAFGEAGYSTACYGKWHNGAHYPYDPIGQGFDRFFGFKAGHWTNYFDTPLISQNTLIPTEGYISDLFTDSALAFMARKRETPFFCFLPYNAPHSPFQVADRHYEQAKARGLSDKNAAIYAMIENLDGNLGRLISGLDSLGIRENTLVIFLTDNGPNGNRYNGGMRGKKASVHEGGVRVPCFISWPGQIPAGRLIAEPSAHIDLFPTLMDLCNIQPAHTGLTDGRSLAALLSGEKDSLQERTFFTHHCRSALVESFPGAARNRRYRYERLGQTEEALYDIIADPGQLHNIIQQKPQIAQRLSNSYDRWFEEVASSYQGPAPVPLGYDEGRRVYLPAHEAILQGKPAYKASPHGWAHDWIMQWQDSSDRISWEVEVVEAGDFEVYLQYTCTPEDSGAVIGLEVTGADIPDQRIFSLIDPPFTPQSMPSPDRVPRAQEAFEQSWGELFLGQLSLREGKQKISLLAAEIPGNQVGEVKGLRLDKNAASPTEIQP